ncbi:MAG: heparinase II/III family protein, partial [Lachnospiraceae bacterium]|nr:heparinase II/III family protein [Lachnospiraceae bacterium]
LAEGLRVQILDDGMQWEQSPMYHNEVFHCSLEALRLAKRYGIPLPETYVETIRRMAYANLTWKKPNHCQVTQGDSDETDLRDLLSQSAYLFSDPVLKSGGFSCMDFDGAWDYLQEGAERYEAMEAQEPDFLVKDMECSGNFYLRSGWTENSDFFHFRSGSLGGGHGHSEKLHMDLVIGGEDILMDSGRYHYVDDEIRHTLKNALSHNTPTIDSRDYVTCLDSWGVKGMSPAYHRPFCQKNGFTLVQGGHAGYLQEGLGDVYINRRVLALGTDLYVVADEFFTAGEHEFQQNFHFNPDGKVKLKNAGDDLGCGENGSPIPSAHYSGQTVDADFIFVESPAKTCDSSLQVQLKDSRLSRNYNQMENNQSLTISRKKSGFCCLLTVIAGGKKDSYQAPEVTPLEVTCSAGASVRTEEEAHGLRIAFNGKTYVVIISHTDIGHNSDLLAAGGYLGLGTVIVFEEGDAKTGGTVMCW